MMGGSVRQERWLTALEFAQSSIEVSQGRDPKVPGSKRVRKWYIRRRPCGAGISTLLDLINWLGNPRV